MIRLAPQAAADGGKVTGVPQQRRERHDPVRERFFILLFRTVLVGAGIILVVTGQHRRARAGADRGGGEGPRETEPLGRQLGDVRRVYPAGPVAGEVGSPILEQDPEDVGTLRIVFRSDGLIHGLTGRLVGSRRGARAD